MSLTTSAGAARLALQVSLARVPGLRIEEEFEAYLDGAPLASVPLDGPHFGVVNLITLPAQTPAGAPLTVAYQARVEGAVVPAQGRDVVPPGEALTYLRPSRYAESDHLTGTARREFEGLVGADLARAVTAWVRTNVTYVPGFSRVTDGAVETLLARAGVCRDFAHLVVAFLRALDVPARVVSVYAPGLSPMDFHAVAEAWVDGAWHVADATGLAPRQSMLRIATGRDAADTAFLSGYGAPAQLEALDILAIVEGTLPTDDGVAAVRLA